jgi:short-subunit dehydrogenase
MNKGCCLILGGLSDIGKSLAYEFASNGWSLILAAREVTTELEEIKQDLQIRFNVLVHLLAFDGTAVNTHERLINTLPVFPNVLVSVFGYLGNQEKAMLNFNESARIISSNFVGHVSLINRYLELVKGKGAVCIIGISSVAGERGRQSNFIYGASKAAFTTYLSGLRNSLYGSDIHVLTVKPGFVKTKMLAELTTPSFLTANPEYVAKTVYTAFVKKKDVVYVYAIWRYIMFLIKLFPEVIFKRLSL